MDNSFVDKYGKAPNGIPAQNFDAELWKKNQEIRVKQVEETMKKNAEKAKSQLKQNAEVIAKNNPSQKQPTPTKQPTK